MDNGGCETFVADCRLRQATDLIAHTWDPLVLVALRRGTTRRRDLLGAIGGVSDKVLSQALARLTKNGLIVRTAIPADQRGVAYELTPTGLSLATGPLAALARWATDNGDHLVPTEWPGPESGK
ncbi:winged helix-turn-helix transcriptional regulator [Kribbella sp. NPDC051620]|uniref:winged helix-turn-helix transcriptional regulator n=1 Tax=Kribbella sp. NPDC051620 TaxID=3364120 RepID=UPI0037A0FF42